jgi:metal-responsive CopG/Arc/MetJ family transcriptional regulator
MTTELVTFKMEHDFLEEVDRTAKSAGFQNRTEFIRNALREKVEEVRMKQAMITLSKLRGKAPIKTTDEERAKIREKVFREFEKKIICSLLVS